MGPRAGGVAAREFRGDPLTDRERGEILAMVRPSYENAELLLGQEYAKNGAAYFIRAGDGSLAAMFMVGCEHITGTGADLTAVYLGLSAVRDDQRGKGFAALLYRSFLNDAIAFERNTGAPLWLWGTTASPIVCVALWDVWGEAEPLPTGYMSHERIGVLENVYRVHEMDRHRDAKYAFVVRRYSEARYSDTERSRHAAFSDARGHAIISKFDIDEREGDRLVFVLRVRRDP
jgi:GNAT superfamily N-acetyltransferase